MRVIAIRRLPDSRETSGRKNRKAGNGIFQSAAESAGFDQISPRTFKPEAFQFDSQ
jgi:hypothetical protein